MSPAPLQLQLAGARVGLLLEQQSKWNIGKVFTITEKAPTWAFSWLKAPSRGLLRDFEILAERSFAALLPELGRDGGVGDLVADSDTSHFTFSILAVLGCVTSGSSDHLIWFFAASIWNWKKILQKRISYFQTHFTFISLTGGDSGVLMFKNIPDEIMKLSSCSCCNNSPWFLVLLNDRSYTWKQSHYITYLTIA